MHHRNWLTVSCILQLYPQQSDLLVSSLSCRSAFRLSSQFHLYSTLQLSACAVQPIHDIDDDVFTIGSRKKSMHPHPVTSDHIVSDTFAPSICSSFHKSVLSYGDRGPPGRSFNPLITHPEIWDPNIPLLTFEVKGLYAGTVKWLDQWRIFPEDGKIGPVPKT